MENLVSKAQSGDHEAFAELYRLHKPWVTKLCRRLANHNEHEDMAQEVFLHLYRKIHKFSGRSSFKTWLYRMTINTCLMARRKKRIQTINVFDWRLDYNPALPRTDSDLHIDLVRHLARLPRTKRRSLIDHQIAGLNHKEIASKYNLYIGTSKRYVSEAKADVRAAVSTESV